MKKIILLISLLIFSQISLAQDSITINKKPKIGLVLSGGGAKGLAHIGVKAFREDTVNHFNTIGVNPSSNALPRTKRV